MNVVEFPLPAADCWKLEQEFDNLRFDIQSARAIADMLRHRGAEKSLANSVARENLENTLIHLGSLIAFLSDVKDVMEGTPVYEEPIPEHIRQSWTAL